MFLERVDGGDDGVREVLRLCALGEAAKPGREDLPPIDADLPRAALVGEEDDVVGPLVDVPQQREDDVERLTRLGRLALARLRDAAIELPAALGDERACARRRFQCSSSS